MKDYEQERLKILEGFKIEEDEKERFFALAKRQGLSVEHVLLSEEELCHLMLTGCHYPLGFFDYETFRKADEKVNKIKLRNALVIAGRLLPFYPTADDSLFKFYNRKYFIS